MQRRLHLVINSDTSVQSNLAKGRIATSRDGEWTRPLRALVAVEQKL